MSATTGRTKKKDAAERVDAVERALTERFFGVMQRMRQFTSGQSAELGLSVVQARAWSLCANPFPCARWRIGSGSILRT